MARLIAFLDSLFMPVAPALTSPSPATMKFAQLRDQYLTDSTNAGTAADALAFAQATYQSATAAASKSGQAFATAIVAKGGEVSDVQASPPVTYRSDGLAIKVVALVTMDDDAPDAPVPAPAPTPDPAPVDQPTS